MTTNYSQWNLFNVENVEKDIQKNDKINIIRENATKYLLENFR